MVSLRAYKTNRGFIGKINASNLNSRRPNENLKFIVILDQSGSMGNAVPRF
eukprot:jgi/Orpsp1_1/1184967/evm.model.c7180000091761.1